VDEIELGMNALDKSLG